MSTSCDVLTGLTVSQATAAAAVRRRVGFGWRGHQQTKDRRTSTSVLEGQHRAIGR